MLQQNAVDSNRGISAPIDCKIAGMDAQIWLTPVDADPVFCRATIQFPIFALKNIGISYMSGQIFVPLEYPARVGTFEIRISAPVRQEISHALIALVKGWL